MGKPPGEGSAASPPLDHPRIPSATTIPCPCPTNSFFTNYSIAGMSTLRLLLCTSLIAIAASFGSRLMGSGIERPQSSPFTSSCLFQASELSPDESKSSSDSDYVRFLGRGKHAIVRPGVVLLAPPDEFHHYLRHAAVFIYAMGTDDDDVYVVRGVIIDHPTPFTIQEMMPIDATDTDSEKQVFLQNLLYRGGELGDAAFMLHSDEDLGKDADQDMIGTSGVFQGGLDRALEKGYSIHPDKAKFFFSYMEFTEKELEEMLDNREEDSTQWVSVEVLPEFILSSEWDRGEAWARLRNAVRER